MLTRTPRTRVSGEDRERLIVREAIAFFSEVGFGGDTSALAKRLNVTQPLLYRYFASKEALIERVFQELFVANWNPHWEEILTDSSRPLEARLIEFHQDFARAHLVRERVRLALFFALRGQDMRGYFKLMRDRVYVPIAAGLREYTGQPGLDSKPLHEVEVEVAKMVIDKIQYYGIRKFVYEVPVPEEIESVISISVRAILDGARVAIPAFQGVGAIYQWGKSPYEIWKKKRVANSPGETPYSGKLQVARRTKAKLTE